MLKMQTKNILNMQKVNNTIISYVFIELKIV